MTDELNRRDLHGLRSLRRPGASGIGAAGSRLGRLGSGQELLDLFADHGPAFERLEANDQADFSRLAADRIPGNPDAVGMAQLRLAVVLGELVGGEDVFAVGLGVGLGPVLFVEGVYRQRAGDLDRFFLVGFVEHQPGAETARRKLPRRGKHRVAPDRDDAHRTSEFARLAHQPRHAIAETELRATRRNEQQQEQRAQAGNQGSEGRMVHSWLVTLSVCESLGVVPGNGKSGK